MLQSRPLTGMIVAAVLLVGCSPSDDGPAFDQASYREAADDFWGAQADFAEQVVDCMAEQGFHVNTTFDYGFTPPRGLDATQMESYRDAMDDCFDEVYPESRPLTDEDIEWFYGMLLAAAECLEDEGYEVPEPPTMAAYVSAFRGGGEEPLWTPYNYAMNESFEHAMTVCPHPGSIPD